MFVFRVVSTATGKRVESFIRREADEAFVDDVAATTSTKGTTLELQ